MIAEWSAALIVSSGDATAVAILSSVDNKAVEVVALPAHHDLEDAVECVERRVARDKKSPPDHGADGAEMDLELVDAVRRERGIGSHGQGRGRAWDLWFPSYCPTLLHALILREVMPPWRRGRFGPHEGVKKRNRTRQSAWTKQWVRWRWHGARPRARGRLATADYRAIQHQHFPCGK